MASKYISDESPESLASIDNQIRENKGKKAKLNYNIYLSEKDHE